MKNLIRTYALDEWAGNAWLAARIIGTGLFVGAVLNSLLFAGVAIPTGARPYTPLSAGGGSLVCITGRAKFPPPPGHINTGLIVSAGANFGDLTHSGVAPITPHSLGAWVVVNGVPLWVPRP